MKGKRAERKHSGLFMKLCVTAIILQVIVYTWAHLFWSKEVGMELAPVTSAAFYGFCGFEAGVCGYLKKNRKNQE